jgi:molybdenum cofactor cytidylyltransferase
MKENAIDDIVGILLAAGSGTRFDPSGVDNKLMQVLPGGDTPVAVAAARNLLGAVTSVLAVVRPGDSALASMLRAQGCEVTECAQAASGMGASLAHALRQRQHAAGWVIALADMPYVEPTTIEALVAAIEQGAQIAVPVHDGRRGNPVAFGRTHLARLLELGGDVGARSLLRTFPVTEVALDDRAIHHDVDLRADLKPWTT